MRSKDQVYIFLVVIHEKYYKCWLTQKTKQAHMK